MKTNLAEKATGNRNSKNKILSRERLNDLLLDNLDKNAVFIYSPPGYGKSTLVKDFFTKNEFETAELVIKDDIDFVYTFFIRLIEALKCIHNDFGKFTYQIIESRRERFQLSNKLKSVIEDVVSTFYNEFRTYFSEETYLIIEDLHNLNDLFLFDESKWAIDTFNSLLSKTPDNLHFIVITRQLPDLNFTQLIIKDKLLKIGIEDLKFQNKEIEKLLLKNYAIRAAASDVKLLRENLGGWITGIKMLLDTFGSDFKKIQIDYQKIPENTFNYLAEEIFRHLDRNVQNFLLSTSLLDEFNSDISNDILKIENSREIIDYLLSKNIFINIKSDNIKQDKSFQYQVLFKRFLISKLNEIYSAEDIKLLIEKIYKYYESKGDMVSALNYLLITNDYKKAIPVIIENFEHLFHKGKYEHLWKWISGFEKDVIAGNPFLLYYSGILYKYFIGDLETSLFYLEKAIFQFRQLNDTKHLIKCSINKAGVLVNLGKSRDALLEISDLLKHHNTPENKADLLYFSAYAHYQNADYDLSLNCLNESLKICNEKNITRIRTHISNLMGNICLIKGDYDKAIQYYEWVVENDVNIIDKFETICNLILLFSQSGQFMKSKECLSKLDIIIRQFPTPIFKIPYLLAKQAYYFESADYKSNLNVLEEIYSIAFSMNHNYYLYLSHRLMTDTFYYMNNYEKVSEHYNKAIEYLDHDNELEKIELSVVKTIMLKKHFFDPAIEVILLHALEYYERNNFDYSKAQICLQLGDYYLKTKNKQKALKYIEECLRICSEKQYISYLQREMCNSKEIMKFAASNNIYKEFLYKL